MKVKAVSRACGLNEERHFLLCLHSPVPLKQTVPVSVEPEQRVIYLPMHKCFQQPWLKLGTVWLLILQQLSQPTSRVSERASFFVKQQMSGKSRSGAALVNPDAIAGQSLMDDILSSFRYGGRNSWKL